MRSVLPQQRLLLELLVMSGDVAIEEGDRQSLPWRTLMECVEAGWATKADVSQGFHAVSITDAGREMIG